LEYKKSQESRGITCLPFEVDIYATIKSSSLTTCLLVLASESELAGTAAAAIARSRRNREGQTQCVAMLVTGHVSYDIANKPPPGHPEPNVKHAYESLNRSQFATTLRHTTNTCAITAQDTTSFYQNNTRWLMKS
jgi:hypothetical protein